MAERHKLKTVTKIYSAQILSIIRQDNFLDLKELSFDYITNKILYRRELLPVKQEAIRFKLEYPEYSFDFKEFGDVLWYIARQNTPEEETEDPLEGKVVDWLEKNSIHEVRVLEIIEKVLRSRNLVRDLSDTALSRRVAAILRKHGFQNKHTRTGTVWKRIIPVTDVMANK